MGRPSSYTKAKGDAICRRLAEGESLKKITDEKAQPTRPTVYKWLRDIPEFLSNYTRAREEQAEAYAEDITTIADEPCKDNVAVQRNRLRMDARKWIASKLLPKKYGDRLGVEHSGEIGIRPMLFQQVNARENGQILTGKNGQNEELTEGTPRKG